jgi:hypothetical protein
MCEIDIKASFKMCQGLDIKYTICIKNISGSNISNVEVISKFTSSSFDVIGSPRQVFDAIPNGKECITEFIFKVPEDFYNERIGAYVIYYNQNGKKCFASIIPQKINFPRYEHEEKKLALADSI